MEIKNMLFPNEKIIYEIPIYSMPEKEFQRRWNKWKNDWNSKLELRGYTEEEIRKTVDLIIQRQYPKDIWKYNQIVGFVEIALGTGDISFNVQKTLDSRINARGKKKHYIQDMMTNGMHFDIENLTNKEIVGKIDQYLDSIQKTISKPFYLYRDTFNLIKNYIDYEAIQKNIM